MCVHFDNVLLPKKVTSAQWASTGGQVAYFKKIYFFFLISLVLSFSLMFNYEPSLLRHPDIAPLL